MKNAETTEPTLTPHKPNLLLQTEHNVTALFYDILDYPWERMYRLWRPGLVGDLTGKVLEAGVGTGRNLEFYPPHVELVGLDLSRQMLRKAEKRIPRARCMVQLVKDDAAAMQSIDSNQFDWIVSTFLCCVMPDEIQPSAIEQFGRVLKPGGRFRLLEIVFSNNKRIRRRQKLLAPLVEKIYGARFDRNTLRHLERSTQLKITSTSFLKDDTHLLIEGIRL